MNLHRVVRGAITRINPDIPAQLKRSLGYTVEDDGTQVPKFEMLRGNIQVQPLSTGDLQHVNNLNLQGTLRSVYLYGTWFGVVRSGEKGGDILTFKDVGSRCDSQWLVVNVAEAWPDWTRVYVCLQSA